MTLQKDIGVMFLEDEHKPSEVPPLRRLGFTVAYKCDGNCTYCFTKPDKYSERTNVEDEISKEEFEEILRQAIPLGLKEIQLSGGEPLLKKDIFEFVKIAKDLGIRVGIFTNGNLLNQDVLEKLKALKLDWIRVGLGGSSYEMSQKAGRLNDTKEKFEKILNNIKASVEAGFVTGVFTPVTKNNYLNIRATAELAKDLGVNYIVFCNYIPLGNEQDSLNRMSVAQHYQAIEELLKAREEQRGKVEVYAYYGFIEYLSPSWKESDAVLKGPCGRERLAFIANGDIRTCLCTTQKLSSFREKDFNLKKIWTEHPFILKIRKNKKFEPCLHCKRKDVCQPCLTPTININKNINTPPPQCPAVREYKLFKKTMDEQDAIKKALRQNFEEYA